MCPHAPVQRDAHHAQQTDSHVSVEDHWEYLAECVAQGPFLHRVPNRLQWHANRAEQQIGDAQGDDEGRCGVCSQLRTSDQGQQCYQVA